MSSLIRRSTCRDDAVVIADRAGTPRAVAESALLEEARQQAEAASILTQARREAGDILWRAREDAAAARLAAYEEGYQEGRRESVRIAEERFAAAIELLLIAATDTKNLREHILRSAERDAIEMALDIARQVVGEAAASDPTLAADLAERALARAGNQAVLRVRVHPERREVVAAAFAERVDATGNPLDVTADDRIDLGGCVIDLRSGTVDARIGTQLARVADVLRRLLDEESL